MTFDVGTSPVASPRHASGVSFRNSGMATRLGWCAVRSVHLLRETDIGRVPTSFLQDSASAASVDHSALSGSRHSSGAMVTFKPSSEWPSRIWHARRDVSRRCDMPSNRPFSSSVMGGRRPTKAGSIYTWQVAQEQHPPHTACSSAMPPSRIASIKVQSASTHKECSSPLREVASTLAILCLAFSRKPAASTQASRMPWRSTWRGLRFADF
jgi:hypothetical protein